MESGYQNNRNLSRLELQSFRLNDDYGSPLHIVIDNARDNDNPGFPMNTTQRFCSQVENSKKNIITLRCLPLNVKEIRLGSGCERKNREKKGTCKEELNTIGNTIMDLKNIEEDLKDLYCYMQDLKSTRGMPLDLSHYLSIICRLQNIRDSFRDFRESFTPTNFIPMEPENLEKPNIQAEKESKMTMRGSQAEKTKKDKVVKEKTPSITSTRVGCCGCGSKKKSEGKDDTCRIEEAPKCKQTLIVPCVIVPDYKDKTDSSTADDTRKSQCEIQVCCNNRVDRQNQVPSETSTKNSNKKNAFQQTEDSKGENCKTQTSSQTTTAKQVNQPMVSICEAEEKQEKGISPIEERCTEPKKKSKGKKDKPTEIDPKPEVDKSSKKQKKEKSKKENTSESKLSKPSDKTNAKEYCYKCYGPEVPTITSNLANTIKKYTGQTHSTVFLEISAIEDNLYRIHISTLANRNVGCVFATGEAIDEAKKQKAFDGYITLSITKSTTSTLTMNDVKHMVDYPFELCDR